MDQGLDIGRRFATRTGFCYITDEALVLTQEGFQGKFQQLLYGQDGWRHKRLAIGLGVLALAAAAGLCFGGSQEIGLGVGFIGLLYLGMGLMLKQHCFSDPRIHRKDIRSLTFVKGSADVKPHFQLELAGGRQQQIELPGMFAGGAGVSALAKQKLREEGLLD